MLLTNKMSLISLTESGSFAAMQVLSANVKIWPGFCKNLYILK